MTSQMRLDIPDVKPAYRIPLMEEIHEREETGLTVVSTFSGCGGSCLGFKMAGYRAMLACEFVPAAADSYHSNFPDVPLVVQDVRQVEGEMILARIGLGRGELDVLEGSPPCASFSMAGKREAAWGQVKKYSDVEQRTDDLFDEYVRLLDQLQPKVFVAENVEGLTVGVARHGRIEKVSLDGLEEEDREEFVHSLDGFLDRIVRQMEGCGYRVWAKVLNAARLGVPQSRRRLIFVGVRKDLGRPPTMPRDLDYVYSIKDAIGLDFHGHEIARGRRVLDSDEPLPTLQTHGNLDTFSELSVPTDADAASIERFAIGDEWDRLEVGESSQMRECPYCKGHGEKLRHGGGSPSTTRWNPIDPDQPLATVITHQNQFEMEKCETCKGRGRLGYFSLVRPDPDKPLPTVTQTGGNLGAAGVTHPTEKRKFTIAELKRLCGFPDDFILTGTFGQQWERLGRAVPPPMMYHVAMAIRRDIFDK